MSDKSFGLSIDGSRVTVVEALGDIAVSSTSVDAGSLADSLEIALSAVKQKRNDPPLRVSLVASGLTLRRIDVTQKVASSRADFEDAVFAVLPVNRDTTAVSGAFFDPEAMVGDAVTPGVAVIAPAGLVEEIYALLDKRRCEVVASPLALFATDGIWLGVHDSVTDVTLVAAGRPVAYRQLRIGGLGTLKTVLGDPADPALGANRLSGALTGTGPDDPGARIEISRFMRMLAAELGQTLDYWRRTGESVPTTNELVLYGPGGSSALAHAALSEAGYRSEMPQELAQSLSYVPLGARGEAVAAFSAALTVGRHMPQAAFVNPKIADVLAARRKARRRVVAIAAGAGVLVAAALGLGRPVYQGYTARQDADRELARIESEFRVKENVYNQTVDLAVRSGVLAEQRASEPYWPEVFTVLLASLPEGAAVSQISTSGAEGVVSASVAVDLAGGEYADLVAWLDRLNALDGVSEAWSSGFSKLDETASFRVNVTMTTTGGSAVEEVEG